MQAKGGAKWGIYPQPGRTLGALLSGGGLAEVSSWPSPLPALHNVAGTRREP